MVFIRFAPVVPVNDGNIGDGHRLGGGDPGHRAERRGLAWGELADADGDDAAGIPAGDGA